MDTRTGQQLAVLALVVGTVGFALASGATVAVVSNANRISELESRADATDGRVTAVATELYVRTAPAEYGGPIEPSSLAEALAAPCATEDSIDCYWIADTRTNGIGASFVNVEGHIFPLTSLLGDAS